MIAYRVEHPRSGKGPYRTGHTDDHKCYGTYLCDKHNGDPSKWPSPSEDGITITGSDRRQYKFGFESLRDLRQWFRTELDSLHELGFVIALFDTQHPCTQVGSRQVAFLTRKPFSTMRLYP